MAALPRGSACLTAALGVGAAAWTTVRICSGAAPAAILASSAAHSPTHWQQDAPQCFPRWLYLPLSPSMGMSRGEKMPPFETASCSQKKHGKSGWSLALHMRWLGITYSVNPGILWALAQEAKPSHKGQVFLGYY